MSSSRPAGLSRIAALYPLSLWWALAFLLLHTGLRVVLALTNWQAADLDAGQFAQIFVRGLGADLATLVLLLPLLMAVESALGRRRSPPGRLRKMLVWGVAAGGLYAFAFGVLAEWFFWDEFGVRFNFIAVDYLVYTEEVVGNIRESYPVGRLLAALALGVGVALWLGRRWVLHAAQPSAPRGVRVAIWLASVALAWVTAGLSSLMTPSGQNEYRRELAANGLYSLGDAFLHNSLDYFGFYPTSTQPAAPRPAESPRIVAATPPRNIVIVTLESLSSRFTAHGGNTESLTPNLDRLADSGLYLSQLYAAGNRTVRGLEALSLAIPPQPGHAIIWRPDNQNLETLGAVLADHGYVSRFVYGGYARFDNMDNYFSGNHYSVADRTRFPNRHRGFANIWGLADEHVYDYALEQMDADARAGHPFLMHIMTTSNHSPFTFPEGRVDLPRGRKGAVKYADWALGRFIAAARNRPWFEDTVFVLVADHCASSKGKTSLPPENYHIPAILYAPAHLPARTDTRMASQIDLVPTLLDLLNLPEHQRFMGRSVLRAYPDAGRAFIATYQKLGYLTPTRLVVLTPGRKTETWALDAQRRLTGTVSNDPLLTQTAIQGYEEAARRLRDGTLRHVTVAPRQAAVGRGAPAMLVPGS